MGHLLYKVILGVSQELTSGLKGVGHVFSFKLEQKKSPYPPPHIYNDRSLIARFSLPERIISPYELPELVTLGTDLIFGYCLLCFLLFVCNLNNDSYATQPFLSLGINHICSLVVHMLLAFLTFFCRCFIWFSIRLNSKGQVEYHRYLFRFCFISVVDFASSN